MKKLKLYVLTFLGFMFGVLKYRLSKTQQKNEQLESQNRSLKYSNEHKQHMNKVRKRAEEKARKYEKVQNDRRRSRRTFSNDRLF